MDVNTAFYFANRDQKLATLKEKPPGFHLEWHNGERSGFTALTRAASNNDTDVLKILIDENGNVEARDNHDATPLMRAVGHGMLDSARMLIDYGAILDAQDKWGWTALMWAAAYGKRETLRLLLNRGATATMKNNVGETALILSTTEEIQADIRAKLEPKREDKKGGR